MQERRQYKGRNIDKQKEIQRCIKNEILEVKEAFMLEKCDGRNVVATT